MIPFYFCFPDEKTAVDALKPVRDTNLDVIGESWRNDGEYATLKGQRTVTKAPTKREGYFANWLGEKCPPELEPYVTHPASPFRVFSGWHPDEIKAREQKE